MAEISIKDWLFYCYVCKELLRILPGATTIIANKKALCQQISSDIHGQRTHKGGIHNEQIEIDAVSTSGNSGGFSVYDRGTGSCFTDTIHDLLHCML